MNLIDRRSDFFKQCKTSIRLEKGDKEKLIEVQDSKSVQFNGLQNRRFNFDQIFNTEDSNYKVFENFVMPLIQEFLKGQNTTIYSYIYSKTKLSQTFYGYEEHGVIQMAAEFIFTILQTKNFKMTIKFNEVLNEQTNDLLASRSIIKEESEILTLNQFLKLYQLGQRKRKYERHNGIYYPLGHAIFEITLNLNHNSKQQEYKLTFVELVGQEQINNLQINVNKRLNYESASKKKSLFTFYELIEKIKYNSTSDQKKILPFQNSVLTIALKQAIQYPQQGFIFTISNTQDDYELILQSLELSQNLNDIRILNQQNQQKGSEQKIMSLKKEERQQNNQSLGELQQLIVSKEGEINNLKKIIKLLYIEMYSNQQLQQHNQKKKTQKEYEQPMAKVEEQLQNSHKENRQFYNSFHRKISQLQLKIDSQNIDEQIFQQLSESGSDQSDQSESESDSSHNEVNKIPHPLLNQNNQQLSDKFDFSNKSHYDILRQISPMEFYDYFANKRGGQIRNKVLLYLSDCSDFKILYQEIMNTFNFQINGMLIFSKEKVSFIVLIFNQIPITANLNNIDINFIYINTKLKKADISKMNKIMTLKLCIQDYYTLPALKKYKNLYNSYQLGGKKIEFILKSNKLNIIQGLELLMGLDLNKKIIQYHLILKLVNQLNFLVIFQEEKGFIMKHYLAQYFDVSISKINQDLDFKSYKLYYSKHYNEFECYELLDYQWKRFQLTDEVLNDAAYQNIYLD
ncbi:Kinesin- motor protein [Paramecium bursaria]